MCKKKQSENVKKKLFVKSHTYYYISDWVNHDALPYEFVALYGPESVLANISKRGCLLWMSFIDLWQFILMET